MENLSFLSGAAVDHEVNGQSLRFYPVSIRLAFQMRNFLAPLAKALGVLLQDDRDDTRLTGYENRSVKQADGTEMHTTEMEPIRPEVLQQLNARKDRAVDELVIALTSEDNARMFARLIMDALRDDFPRKPNDAQVAEFLDSMDASAFVEALTGFARANKKVFDPFLSKVAPKAREAAEGVAAGVAQRLRPVSQTTT